LKKIEDPHVEKAYGDYRDSWDGCPCDWDKNPISEIISGK